MEALGAAFRALVSGLRLALIARSAIKGEFRIEQTMIRSRGNNPLKFSADDDDALLALLGAGRRTEMSAAEAVADALRDMRLHEIATVAAMRSARARAVLTVRPGEASPRRRARRTEPRAGAEQGARLGGVRGALCRKRARRSPMISTASSAKPSRAPMSGRSARHLREGTEP